MSVEYVIRCNECDDVIDSDGASAASVRRTIKQQGRGQVKANGIDLCWQHRTDNRTGQ